MTSSHALTAALALAGLVAVACAGDSSTQVSTSNVVVVNATNTAIPVAFRAFSDSVVITVESGFVVLRSKSVPDHKSAYFATTDSRYQAYNGTNAAFSINPNRIASQQLVFRIPLNPTEAASKAATPLGPIGISLNGVAIFNQYAGPGKPLSNEINSFDQANGHPQQTGQYHYHVEPLRLTEKYGQDALLGFLLDGFPVYGPTEGTKTLTNADLDLYHGHTSATKEYPSGIYHYHITNADPYIHGAGFWGPAGTVGQ